MKESYPADMVEWIHVSENDEPVAVITRETMGAFSAKVRPQNPRLGIDVINNLARQSRRYEVLAPYLFKVATAAKEPPLGLIADTFNELVERFRSGELDIPGVNTISTDFMEQYSQELYSRPQESPEA